MCWKILKKFGCAARGVWRCVREERHFRFHLVIAAYVLILAPYFALSRTEWAVLALTITGVVTAEAVNSSIERTLDRVSEEQHPLTRTAKDMAAGAVLLSAVGAVAVAIALFWQPTVWFAIFNDWIINWYKPVLLALIGVAAIWFVGKWRTT